MILDKEKFCILPFSGLSISPRGVIRPCCAQHSFPRTDLDNIRDKTIGLFWPTEYIKIVQKKMLEPDPMTNLPECSQCWTQEKHNILSMRQVLNDYVKQNKSEKEIEDLIIHPSIEYLDLQFGHLCNSSCLMCYPSTSSTLQSTYIKLKKISDNEEQLYYTQSISDLSDNDDWTKDYHAYEKLLKLSENISSLKISGGEPFFNPRFNDYLEYLLTKKVKVTRIHVTTNGTIYNRETVNLLKRFEFLTLKTSFESTEKQEEFIRHPAIWNEKVINVKRLFKEIDPAKKIINICVQSLNALELEKNIEYFKNSFENTIIEETLVNLDNIVSLGQSDKPFIDHILNATNHKTLKKYALSALHYNGDVKRHTNFIYKNSLLQKKNLNDIFPIWFRYHEKFIN